MIDELRLKYTGTRLCNPERLQQDIAALDGVQLAFARARGFASNSCFVASRSKNSRPRPTRNISFLCRKSAGKKFEATAPNYVWLRNITYILTGESWLYLAEHKDIFNGEIVGHALDARMTDLWTI